ncbi:hypothetical protein K438DRAFT_1991758 [Mycena galopus ATCC 62051]|nr:hypothetical protein K438DRAFT_1991758 [Mycena galopus ATCC 62051]
MPLPLVHRSWSPDPHICTQVILALIIPGVGLTATLLALYGCAAWNPVSRRYLDRVSFRLLTWALVAHLVFGILFTVGALTAYPGWRCALLSFVTNMSLVFSAGMFFCIAFNLPLVLAFNVNGQKMEKYYIVGTTLICLIANLAPYASGNLGWDEVNDSLSETDALDTNSYLVVGYRSDDPAAMLRWLIGTQTFWILLASVGEVGTFIIIVGYLIAYGFTCRHLPVDTQATYSSEASDLVGSKFRKFRHIILRIGLYPLVSCMFNISTAVIDFDVSRDFQRKHLHASEVNWRLNLADLAIYAGRPLIYGLLAATDPSFIRALRALRHPEGESETQSDSWDAQRPEPSACFSTVFDLPSDATEDNTLRFLPQAHLRTGEASTISAPRIEVEKPRSSNERLDQTRTRDSIDVVCHI